MDPIDTQIAEAQARLKKLEDAAEKAAKPVTSNASGIADAARAPITGRPAWEHLDPLKGKALGFASAARCVALSRGNYEAAMSLAKSSAVPHYGEGVVGLVKGAFDEHSGAKAMGESTLAGGGALNPDPMAAEFIELLRPAVVFSQAPVLHIPMGSQTLRFPRESTGSSFAWLGESQNLTATAPAFDQVQLQLKKGGALVAISNDLLRDNAIAADMIVRQDLVAQTARGVDKAYLRGTGNTYQPNGLQNQISSTNQASAGAAGNANTLTLVLADLWTAISSVRSADVPFTKAEAFWVMSPRSEGGLAQLRDGTGKPYFGDEMANGTLLGFKYFTTTQQPDNLSGGGSGGSHESMVTFIVGPQVLVGEGLNPTIQVAPQGAYYDGANVQSGLSRDETAVSIITRTDIAMRHVLAGAVIKGCTYGYA